MMTTQAYDSNILETAEQVRVVWRRVEFKVLIYDERDWGAWDGSANFESFDLLCIPLPLHLTNTTDDIYLDTSCNK